MHGLWVNSSGDNRRRSAKRVLRIGPDTVVAINEGEVRVRVLGQGEPPLIILPDPPNVIKHYDHVLPLLARNRQVICFDLPGFGFFKPPPSYTFAINDTAELIAATLDALGVQGATLSCSCVGAHAALYMIESRPDLVDRILLFQFQAFGAAQAWVRAVSMGGIITTPWIGQVFMGLARRMVVHEWYDVALPKGVSRARYREIALKALRDGARFPLASAFQSLLSGSVYSLPHNLDTTVIWGASDPCHAGSDPRSAIEAMPNARFIELPQVGHFPDLERPAWFVELTRGNI